MRVLVVLSCCTLLGEARRVKQFGSPDVDESVREWELENVARHRTGELNNAELGVANLEEALSDPALLKEVAEWLRQPDGRSRLIQMFVNSQFREEARVAAEQLKKDGVLPNFLRLEYYANQMSDASKGAQVSEAATAFHTPAMGNRHRATRSAAAQMIDFENFYTQSNKKPSGALNELIADAEELNPRVKYWDPLKLAEQSFWGQSNEATIGFLRHAEIKHGRVAMAGFIGFCLHENGIHFPWSYPGLEWSEYEKLGAPAIWDALPVEGRLQIVTVIGFFEWWGESSAILKDEGQAHYMRGGKPGYYPTFAKNIHPVPLNLWDPFGFTTKLSEEAKARKLKIEINNGRLAMIGTMSLLAAARVPGSVPALDGLIKPYTGNVMIPFS
jgi:hypothetical protein